MWHNTDRAVDIVVEALDDEARALDGWQKDDDGTFMLFRASPSTTWGVTQVRTFNPYHADAL